MLFRLSDHHLSLFVATGSSDGTAVGSIAVDTAPLAVLLIAAAALHPSMVELTNASTGVRPEWSRTRCLILVITISLPFTAVLTGPRPDTWESFDSCCTDGDLVGAAGLAGQGGGGGVAYRRAAQPG